MNELFVSCKEEVKKRVREESAFNDETVKQIIFDVISQKHKQNWISLGERVLVGKKIFYSLCRLDVLQPILDDEAVTDIMVNGPNHIYYEKNGQMKCSTEHFEDAKRLEDLIQQIVGSVNRSVNEANPIVDARLADGSRVHVVLPPVALNGPVLTIRRFRKRPITIEELIEWKTLDMNTAVYLQKAVEEKKNIFVCGGTASGKTTLLNVLSNFIPKEERIITIEDAAELRLAELENVVTLETRNETTAGKGKISMRDLIKASLRMNPDRIIVGEIRGEEALDMLQAMNTGHDGSLSTGHANSCTDMLMRIETMVLMGADMPLEAIRQQIASALDLLVFVEKRKGEGRKVSEICRVLGYRKGEILTKRVMGLENAKIIWANEEENDKCEDRLYQT